MNWLGSLPYLSLHAAALLAFYVGVTWTDVVLCLSLYFLRMFAITGGYHRYFSHRTYKTSRLFQFLLGWLGAMSLQKGPLWWAGHHRAHHKYSDGPDDVHSPTRRGLYWAHQGWILCKRYEATDWERVQDLARYPELRWLNRWHLIPPILAGVVLWLLGGVHWFLWGGVISTVLLWHGTFTINSLSHVFGTRRYETTDDSKNNLWLALLTMGEGWHNNHHHYQSAVQQGFFWWEIDMTYYILKVLSWFGIVWDLRRPPAHILAPQQAAWRKAA
jgi:stearoyl-CoA desaturase (delta-9 desaturase)